MRRTSTLTELQTALGCRIKDKKLLERALTHASVRAGSASRKDNERLEFLGDRVLGLVVSGRLFQALPDAREGELARRFNRIVCGAACAEVAREIDLGRFLILSESEAASGGRDKDTILADAMEAVLGAVFLDRGFKVADGVVERLWAKRMDGGRATPIDPKSALQEWAQGRGLPLPKYTVVSRKGPDHAPEFVAKVSIKGLEPETGDGASKRQAEQTAAATMLEREGVWQPDEQVRK